MSPFMISTGLLRIFITYETGNGGLYRISSSIYESFIKIKYALMFPETERSSKEVFSKKVAKEFFVSTYCLSPALTVISPSNTIACATMPEAPLSNRNDSLFPSYDIFQNRNPSATI